MELMSLILSESRCDPQIYAVYSVADILALGAVI